jgi:hypothetical protein
MIDLRRIWWRWVICLAAAMGVSYLSDSGEIIGALLGVLATMTAVLWADLSNPY